MWFKADKYWGWWRGLVPLIYLYNLKNRKFLLPNKELYKKWNLKKNILTSIETKDFESIKVDESTLPWTDRKNAVEILEKKILSGEVSEDRRELHNQWIKDGFVVFKNLFSDKTVERINEEISQLKSDGRIYENYTRTKIHNAIFSSDTLKGIANNNEIVGFLNTSFEREIIAFQSLNFETGSEQKPHSDAFHMTTFPAGFMAAAWIALEDIESSSGPISIFPGSHRLAVVSAKDIPGNTSGIFYNDTLLNEKYELIVQKLLEKSGLNKIVYTPQKGDVLIWHYNLIHGGEPILNKDKSRKSMVVHYFGKGVIAYHEISRRPAIIR